MKNFILSIFTVLVISSMSISQSYFHWENPLPQGNELTNIYFINNQTGFAVGVRGTILKTTNAGINWSLINSPVTQDLSCIKFVNSNTGYIVGDSGKVLKTINAGNNWVASFSGYNNYLSCISFLNQNTGIIGGYSGFVLKTTNAGQNWQIISSSSTGLGNYDIQYIDSNNIYAVNMYYFIKSTNAGLNWTTMTNFSQLYSISFLNSSTGYITGDFGQIFQTINGGISWNNMSLNNNTYKSIQFIDSTIGFICGYDKTTFKGAIFKTTNSGNNWISQLPDTASTLNDLHFLNSNFGGAVGIAGKIFVTTNSGSNWTVRSSGRTTNLSNIQVIDTQISYTVGGKQIWKTSNGGNNWDLVYTASSSIFTLNDLDFFNANKGIITSSRSSGTPSILTTTDGGLTWINKSPPIVTDYFGIDLVNDNLCIAVANAGNIIRSTDFGTTWSSINSGTTHDLRKVIFTSQDTGYICGTGGIILKSTDSGNNWVIQYNLGASPHFYGMSFINSLTGVVTGGTNGLILKTTNGGLNWNNLPIGFINDLRNIKMLDLNSILAIGSNGNMIYSSNGGNNWTWINITRNNLFGISSYGSNYIKIAGNYGTILGSPNGVFVGINSSEHFFPKDFYLYQNYPNPFNPSTKIKFDIVPDSRLRGNDNVVLKIFDIMGREVATLVNEQLQPGTYEAEWDAANFSSGVYYYSLSAGDPSLRSGQGFSETKKMILVK